jgi:hypothetical protein
MSNQNKEFYDLLNSIVDEQTFSLNLSPDEKGEVVAVLCKSLSTIQLKDLIKTIVDSPLTQASFNSTATRVFKQSLTSPLDVSLNIIDRLLFIIETRIQSLSPTTTMKDGDEEFAVNFNEIKLKLENKLKENF